MQDTFKAKNYPEKPQKLSPVHTNKNGNPDSSRFTAILEMRYLYSMIG